MSKAAVLKVFSVGSTVNAAPTLMPRVCALMVFAPMCDCTEISAPHPVSAHHPLLTHGNGNGHGFADSLLRGVGNANVLESNTPPSQAKTFSRVSGNVRTSSRPSQ